MDGSGLFLCADSGPWRKLSRNICQASWPSPTITLDRKRTNEGILFGELSVLLFVCFRSVYGWIGYCGNGCVSECLENAILVRRLQTMSRA